jgi:DNA-binding CsgD family transcriptional regulator/tetratricopeptide (TPR) repeat protein
MAQGTVTTQPQGQSFIIKRPRLTKLLDESEARIILLVAPAGYGKTTLAREWVAGKEGVVWYPASPASTDVAALAVGIALELDRIVGEPDHNCAERLSALAAVHQRPDALARVLAGGRGWPPRLIVAIDDYHQIDTAADSEEFVDTLVRLLPATFLITSRTRPAWFEPKLTIYGEALELGKEELAMTDDEAVEVLGGADRRIDIFEAILKPADGWPAIVGLAARSGAESLPEALPSQLYKYLANDLIAAAPRRVQEALTVLALTGVADAATAQMLLGPTGIRSLGDAELRGLLVRDEHGRIALHPLLAQHLIDDAQRDEEVIAQSIRPVARQLVSTRHWDACLSLAEALPDAFDAVEEVLEDALEDFLNNGRIVTIQRWVDLARKTGSDAPIVDLAEGELAFRAGDFDRAIAFGSRASKRMVSPALRCRAQLLTARAAQLGDKRSLAGTWFGIAETSATSTALRAAAAWGLFLVEYEEETGDLPGALRHFESLTDGSVAHELQLSQGRLLLGLAERNIDAAIEAGRSTEGLLSLATDPLVRLASLNQRAWVLGCGAKYREGLDVAERALNEATETGIDFVVTHALVAQATALIGLRQFAAARRAILRLAAREEADTDGWIRTNTAIANAKLCISLGDLDRAAQHLTLDPSHRQSRPQRAEYDGYRALIAAARGKTHDAATWLERCEGWSNQVEAHAIGATGRALLSIANREPEKSAIAHCAPAIESGFRDVIVIGCRAQPALAQLVARDGRYVDALTAAFIESNDRTIACRAGLDIPRIATRGRSLSPRELEVYELIAHGMTNREIARTLFVSESTTKVHVKHIFEKLGVRSRVEAVRAWEDALNHHEADAVAATNPPGSGSI